MTPQRPEQIQQAFRLLFFRYLPTPVYGVAVTVGLEVATAVTVTGSGKGVSVRANGVATETDVGFSVPTVAAGAAATW